MPNLQSKMGKEFRLAIDGMVIEGMVCTHHNGGYCLQPDKGMKCYVLTENTRLQPVLERESVRESVEYDADYALHQVQLENAKLRRKLASRDGRHDAIVRAYTAIVQISAETSDQAALVKLVMDRLGELYDAGAGTLG